MKKVSQVMVSLVLLMSMLAISCKKNQNQPDPLPDKLVQITPSSDYSNVATGIGSFGYDTLGRLTGISGYVQQADFTSYTYDAASRIKAISMVYGYINPYPISIIYRINYVNELPVSGTMTYEQRDYKSPNSTYYVDSLIYKIEKGLVTEISYLDRKFYYQSTRKLTGTTVSGVSATSTFSYTNGNLTSVRAPYASSTYTYGTKKGIGAANRMKFVLIEAQIPYLYSTNDLLTTSNGNAKTEYAYKYNTSGYPVSAIVNYTASDGSKWIGGLDYHYK